MAHAVPSLKTSPRPLRTTLSVASTCGSTLMRYSPGSRSVKAKLGVSTSTTWPLASRRTRT